MNRKRCFKCSRVRALSQFYAHPMMADGHLNKCKDCTRLDVSADYRAKRDIKRAYDRRRNQTPERKAQVRRNSLVARLRNPEKYKARNMVSAAIRDGRLIRQPCEKCGDKAQAHHEDYSEPLTVRWLCFRHHRAEHGQTF